LQLNDDVQKYIPELPDYSHESQKITILQLLNHTSGLRDYVSLFLAEANRVSRSSQVGSCPIDIL